MIKQSLKKYYFSLNEKFPRVGLFLKRVIKYKKLSNSVKKRVKGQNNRFFFDNAILLNNTLDISGSNNLIEIKNAAVLNNTTFFIRGNNHHILIGENCTFSQGGSIWMEHNNGKLIIGANTTMENVHIAVTEDYSQVTIGEDCMFAYDIDIRTGDSHSILDAKTGKRINRAKNIVIGNHVWLASHCRILKGVHINENCVVGTNSVVTKGVVETGVVLAGNPAKIVKQNIIWARENII